MSFLGKISGAVEIKFNAFKTGFFEAFVGACTAVTNMLGFFELTAGTTTSGTHQKELRQVFIVGKLPNGQVKTVAVVENESGLFEVPDEFTAFQVFTPTFDVDPLDFMFQNERK